VVRRDVGGGRRLVAAEWGKGTLIALALEIADRAGHATLLTAAQAELISAATGIGDAVGVHVAGALADAVDRCVRPVGGLGLVDGEALGGGRLLRRGVLLS